eukprot:2701267-Amphidinium_carterae.2
MASASSTNTYLRVVPIGTYGSVLSKTARIPVRAHLTDGLPWSACGYCFGCICSTSRCSDHGAFCCTDTCGETVNIAVGPKRLAKIWGELDPNNSGSLKGDLSLLAIFSDPSVYACQQAILFDWVTGQVFFLHCPGGALRSATFDERKDAVNAARRQASLERAMQIKESNFGREHPEVAITLHNLAVASATDGGLPLAHKQVQRALQIFVASSL